jgi:hypothetical protein
MGKNEHITQLPRQPALCAPSSTSLRKSRWLPRRRLVAWCISGVAFICLALAACLYGLFSLASNVLEDDYVMVTFTNCPEGTDFVCVVSESDGSVSEMNWVVRMITRDELPVTSGQGQRPADFGPKIPTIRDVAWKPCEKYGVAYRRVGQGWFVTWFDETPRRSSTIDTGSEQDALPLICRWDKPRHSMIGPFDN